MSARTWLVNLWYLLAIGVGLFFAWREGADMAALLFAALGAALIVCLVLVLLVVMRRKQK